MYKTLLFLKSSNKDEVLEYFGNALYDQIQAINGVSSSFGAVDNSILFPENYQKVIEITSESKESMEHAMMSLEGKKFSKALQNFHTYVTLLSFEYEQK